MKLFKSTDDKLAELGFKKVADNVEGVRYKRRVIKRTSYTQRLKIFYQIQNHTFLIQTCDENLLNKDCTDNAEVGLTIEEAELAVKKAKELKKKREKFEKRRNKANSKP
jgi:hypothetical protein